jgi:hypothetical protein
MGLSPVVGNDQPKFQFIDRSFNLATKITRISTILHNTTNSANHTIDVKVRPSKK